MGERRGSWFQGLLDLARLDKSWKTDPIRDYYLNLCIVWFDFIDYSWNLFCIEILFLCLCDHGQRSRSNRCAQLLMENNQRTCLGSLCFQSLLWTLEYGWIFLLGNWACMDAHYAVDRISKALFRAFSCQRPLRLLRSSDYQNRGLISVFSFFLKKIINKKTKNLIQTFDLFSKNWDFTIFSSLGRTAGH